MAGKPQTLSRGQEEHVTRLLRNKLLAWVLIAFAILAGLTGASLWGIRRRAETTMEKMVAKQFEEPRIREVVRQVATDRATLLMSNQISPQVVQFKADVADELREVQALVEKTRIRESEGQKHKASIVGIVTDLEQIRDRTGVAESRLATVETNLVVADSKLEGLNDQLASFYERFDRVTQEQEFLTVANRARLYSLHAFQDLETLSQTTNDFAADANQLVWSLRRQMELDREQKTEYVPIEQAGDYDYKGPFTSEEIATRLRARPTVESGANLARKESLKAFIPQLVMMAQDEPNLWVQNRITYAISTLADENFMPWDTAGLKAWWAGHGTSYTNWPYKTYDEAMSLVGACNYKGALPKLQEIVESDPRADKSRAIAIACACEIGDTNSVAKLNENWKFPKGRWREWAGIRINLSTGAVETATADLADLAEKYKTFPAQAMMSQGNHILRQIDWAKYADILRQRREDQTGTEPEN